MNEEELFELKRPAWQARSNCHSDIIIHGWQEFGDHPVDAFYTDAPPSGSRRRFIAAVCGPCPVQQECRQWAIEHEMQGFWGGEGQTYLARARKEQGVTMVTPELDPRTRHVLGTFEEYGHGSIQRYVQHIRGSKADGNPCEACLEAWRVERRLQKADWWAELQRNETPEEREERLVKDRQRFQEASIRRRRGG